MTSSTSGYTHCACRDCFETATGDPPKGMCLECEDHGCDGTRRCKVPLDGRNGPEDDVMRCPHCGQVGKIQVQVWADPNTGLILDWDGGTYDWCRGCSSEIEDRDRRKLG